MKNQEISGENLQCYFHKMKGTAKEKVVYFHTSNSLETRRMVQELHFCGVISSEKTKLRNTQTTESVQDHTTGTAIRIEGPNCLY